MRKEGRGPVRPLVIAHRGFSGAAPENTLPSFRKALSSGADALEFDLRLTKDSRVVVIHDETVDRTTDGSGKVRSFPFSRLRTLDAGSWYDAPFRGARIPSLEEVLALGKGCRLLLLDTKDQDTGWIGQHEGVLRKFPILVASEFDPFLRAVKRSYPWVRTALTAEKVSDLARAKRLGCSAIDPRYRLVDRAFMKEARSAGLEVYPWTVNAPKEAKRLAALGVDGVITNHPGPMALVLGSRGARPPG